MFGTPHRSTRNATARATSVTITVVQSPACHFCAEAEESLAVLAARYPVHVLLVKLESPEGVHLTQQHRPAMNPLVLVDGRFFSAGRLPRKKLIALLESTTAPIAPSNGS